MFDKGLNAPLIRTSHRMCFVRKGVIRNFSKFTGKHMCQSLFINKVACLRPATLLKKRLWHRCFPVNFEKFLITPFYKTPLGDYFCLIFTSLSARNVASLLHRSSYILMVNCKVFMQSFSEQLLFKKHMQKELQISLK